MIFTRIGACLTVYSPVFCLFICQPFKLLCCWMILIVFDPVCLFVCLFVCFYICLFICLFNEPFSFELFCDFLCLDNFRNLFVPVCLLICRSVCLSICLFICLSVYFSVCLFVCLLSFLLLDDFDDVLSASPEESDSASSVAVIVNYLKTSLLWISEN